MAHPADQLFVESGEQVRIVGDIERGLAVLALIGGNHIAAQLACHQLHPVADTKDRNPQLKDARVYLRGAFVVAGRRTSRKDDANGLSRDNLVQIRVGRDNLAVDAALTDAAGD